MIHDSRPSVAAAIDDGIAVASRSNIFCRIQDTFQRLSAITRRWCPHAPRRYIRRGQGRHRRSQPCGVCRGQIECTPRFIRIDVVSFAHIRRAVRQHVRSHPRIHGASPTRFSHRYVAGLLIVGTRRDEQLENCHKAQRSFCGPWQVELHPYAVAQQPTGRHVAERRQRPRWARMRHPPSVRVSVCQVDDRASSLAVDDRAPRRR